MIYIVSLQYSPVFKSLCYALGNQLKTTGQSIKYILSSQYKWMINEEDEVEFVGRSKDIKTIFIDSIKYGNFNNIRNAVLNDKPEKVYFINIHPFLNNYIAGLVKSYGGMVIQHIHEPYVDDKSPYGMFQRYWLYFFEFIQGLLLKKCDIVILSSQEAWNLFGIKYSNFKGKKLMVPLLYEDFGKNIKYDNLKRKYINFIGPPVPAKGPETFLEIVENCSGNDYKFLLISRMKLQDKYLQYDNLKIIQKEMISDELIGKLMKESIMTITPYKTARQSSVASTAFMYGTPVLATNIKGLNKHITNKKTGYLVNNNSGIDEWLNGLIYIKDNIKRLSYNCRDFFEKNHSEINWPKYFDEVFEN